MENVTTCMCMEIKKYLKVFILFHNTFCSVKKSESGCEDAWSGLIISIY